MRFDLHTHTTASDGLLTPAALVEAAHAAGIELLAITDHDAIDAYAALPPLPPGLHVIGGIELSTAYNGGGVHVVGLNLALGSDALMQALASQRQARSARAERIAERLHKRGIVDALAGAARHAGDAAIGRPHFAAYLVEIGACVDAEAAFRKYLARDLAPASAWPSLATIIEWIRAAGGVAVLAHPGKYGLTRKRLDELTAAFRAAGGAALEVVSGLQRPDVTRDLAALAERHGLALSAGSDFHQPGQAWAALGRLAPLPPSGRRVWELWQ